MVELKPDDSFSRYGLAMELSNSGDLEAAVEQFELLLKHNPKYVAGYFHGGRNLEKLGRIEEARSVYLRGIEVSGEIGDEHTRGELMGALQTIS